jgi:DNA-binding NtrC family response regulator
MDSMSPTTCNVVQTVEEFTLRIQTTGYDIILADYNLPQWSGMEALEVLRHENLDVPLIVVTGYLGEEKAVECIKQGATDCVLKGHLARLPLSVRRALEEKRLGINAASRKKSWPRRLLNWLAPMRSWSNLLTWPRMTCRNHCG